VIKVAICDNAEYLARGYQAELEAKKDFDIVGIVNSNVDCIELVKKTSPDVLITEIRLDSGSITANMLDRIRKVSPETKIIIFTKYEDDEFIYDVFSLGISDYVSKDVAFEKLFAVTNKIYNGEEININSKYAKIIIDECERVKKRQNSLLYVITLLSKLSSSEIDILKELYMGKTYSEIAQRRSTEELTVRSQVSKILKKFGMRKMKLLLEDLKRIDAFAIFDAINKK